MTGYTPFHVTATGHSLNYLPEYIARRHGFFKEQGLDVTVSVPKPWDLVLEKLADGTADAALGGIWVPSMYRHRAKDYTVFAQVANRCPLAVLRRGRAAEPFRPADMVGRTVLMRSGSGASVGLFFKMFLRENAVDPRSVDYVQDLDGKMLGTLFEGGMGDYFLTDNVSARIIAARNRNISIAIEMVTEGGDIPWSVYYRETATVTPADVDAQKRFCAALGKGMDWCMQHDAETYRDELVELFPTAPADLLVGLTNVYRRDKMWTTPTVSLHGYERWQKGISDGRLIEAPFPYDLMVDSHPASAATTQIESGDKAGEKTILSRIREIIGDKGSNRTVVDELVTVH